MKVFALLIISASASIWLSGCATADKIYTSDGRIGYSISCNGEVLDWGACYKKAGKICGARGYDVLSKSGNKGSTFSANQYGAYGGSVIYRSMVIACKKPKNP